ncbi:MAG: phosphatidylinositol-specific phospholipase C1-like protein [Terracidiphilus sp.]|jgi:hypothetical protein
MQISRFAVALVGISMIATGVFAQLAARGVDPDASVRINQIQVIGTHNSYHAGLLPGIAKLMQQRDSKTFATLEYSHADLATQLNHGIRQIELDIFADSKGGRFAHPLGQAMVTQAGLPADPDPYPNGVLMKPGFKVMHIQDIDYVSNCQPFVACLQIVRAWSKAHPEHVPIFILVETKESMPNAEIPWTATEPYTTATFDELDAEIRSVFSRDEMITPDKVRGHHRTLDEAVRNSGWPTLAKARGKVIFLMDVARVGPVYLEGHPALRGRVLFTNATPGHPDAAFVEENDGNPARTALLVRKGYLVRTQADSDTLEARANDTRRRDKVISSGAQIISTDYPQFEPARWSGYTVALPTGLPVQCNPVTGPPTCVDSMLESALPR